VVFDVNAVVQRASVILRISGPKEIRHAEDCARRIAAEVGCSARDCDDIALVVNELASNLIKHASGGELRLEPTEATGRKGLRIESLDCGPGIADFEHAMRDGYSSAGSLGTGLGTINRLMDDLEYEPLAGGGSRIVCHRWLRAEPRKVKSHLEIGVASRAYRQALENGDAFVSREWANGALVGVIDGLGHGQFAHRAAQAARQYIDLHYDLPLEALFRGVGRTCQATRGVVMALALFDYDRSVFTCASIGNIELRVHGSERPIRFIARRGVVGQQAPMALAEEHPWAAGMTLVMHSDGLRARWSWGDFPNLWAERASQAAQRLLVALGRDDDDATVLVVKSARP
jgi:anti-sigma regulatory factor (Ser/Thr protein kinase)